MHRKIPKAIVALCASLIVLLISGRGWFGSQCTNRPSSGSTITVSQYIGDTLTRTATYLDTLDNRGGGRYFNNLTMRTSEGGRTPCTKLRAESYDDLIILKS